MAANMASPRLVSELELPQLPFIEPDRADRLSLLAAAREKHWLAKTPEGYSVLRYEDVVAIHNDKRFVNGINVGLRRAGITDERFLARRPNPFLRAEGADHVRLRRLVFPALSARSADKLRPFMRRELNAMIDAVADRGKADLVEDVFDMFPIAVICELLGAPKEDWQLFHDWANRIFKVYDGTGSIGDSRAIMDGVLAAHRELDEYTEDLIGNRRANPGGDLLTQLITAEEEGDRLSAEELQSIVEAVLLAGTDTTRSQLGIMFATLLRHPDQMALLLERPDLIENTVEESLRFHSSTGGQPRYVHEDTEYKGVIFPAGTLFSTNFVAANFDPTVWGDDAEHFNIARKKERHGQLTFGIGRHLCLGNFIARAELQEALRVVLKRMPGLRVDGEIEWRSGVGGGLWGTERFPVVFDQT